MAYRKKDLDPYTKKAKAIFGIPDSIEFGEPETIKNGHYYKCWDGVLKNPGESFYEKGFFQLEEKEKNFRDKYYDKLKGASNIFCYLNANLTDVLLNKELNSVKNIKIENYNNKTFYAKSKIFVLATGAIENAKLLLNFNKQMKNGIGNENDLVGRFFADHPHYKIGDFILEDYVLDNVQSEQKNLQDIFLASSDKFQKRNETLNSTVRLSPNDKYNLPLVSKSFKYKIDAILCQTQWTTEFTSRLLGHPLDCHNKASHKKSEYDGLVGTVVEPAPNPSSRVMLSSDEKDKFGMKRVALNWQLSKIDKLAYKKVSLEFSKIFANLNLGRVRIRQWVLSDSSQLPESTDDSMAGLHHMGTTRMATSPKEGVVDRNQKVFGIDNFYIAGSSVFPTFGCVNPTFTIVQMTLRLSNHIQVYLSQKS